MQILVAHPGRQHSHQLARALHDENALAEYWTGVPTADPASKGPLYQKAIRYSPQPTTALPRCVVRHWYVMPIVRRLAELVFSPSRAKALRHRAAAWFDAWVARRVPSGLDAVVCYENAARDTFRAAKEQGATTILDAASVHHTWQDAFYEPTESAAAHRRITRRKDEEIALADHVVTVSEFARESYVEAGVPAEQVTSVPMGANLDVFSGGGDRENPTAQPFTFLFAGHARPLKGVDVLLEASEQLVAAGMDHRLQFAGGRDEGVFQNTCAPVESLGYLSHDRLASAFHAADCLVLPSRFDSFGRVVVEALAAGLPAIVSEHVGAKEVLTEGETGWVVPTEDVDALAERMRWCVAHRDQVRDMQTTAARTGQNYSWTAYRERVTDVIASIVER